MDVDRSPDDLNDYLLEVKTAEVELRDEQNELRMKWTKRGFRLLLLSLVTVLIVATLNAVAPVWSENAKERIQAPATPTVPATPKPSGTP